jgi:hypothetical protein
MVIIIIFIIIIIIIIIIIWFIYNLFKEAASGLALLALCGNILQAIPKVRAQFV